MSRVAARRERQVKRTQRAAAMMSVRLEMTMLPPESSTQRLEVFADEED